MPHPSGWGIVAQGPSSAPNRIDAFPIGWGDARDRPVERNSPQKRSHASEPLRQ